MELHLVNLQRGIGLNTTEADIAYRRVDAILRAHGIDHAAIRGAHTQRIVTQAVQANHSASQQLESVAAEQLLNELQRGFEQITASIQRGDASINRNRLLIALPKTKIPTDHPEALLGLDKLTAEESNALHRAYYTQTSPALKRSSMGASALRFESIDEVTSQTIALFEKLPLLKKALPWLASGLAIFLIYQFAK